MTIENKFNLVDEPWIPVAGKGLVSLSNIFSDPSLSALGGNPVQKIALTKLLLAIAQSAYTPKDDEDWKNLGASGLAQKALAYLTAKKNLFWLYGEKPFLQMPWVKDFIDKDANEKNKEPKELGNGDFPNLPNDNNTILLQREAINDMTDADKALFILSLMSFALAGKQCHCNNRKPAIVGPSLGRACFLHTYLTTGSMRETLFLNLLTMENIEDLKFLTGKLGVPVWEWERVNIKRISNTYLEMLVPVCRYILLSGNGVYMTEGIKYPNHKNGWVELTMAVNRNGNAVKVMSADIKKKPWRELVSLLSFVGGQTQFDCPQLRHGLNRAEKASMRKIKIWSGGIDISGDAFGQKVSGSDDFVESEIQLNLKSLDAIWFANLKQEMSELEDVARKLKFSVYKANKREIKESREKDKRADSVSKEAETLFWQLCERKFQELVNACDDDSGKDVKKLRIVIARSVVDKTYDAYCPKGTARQLDAWAANRPDLAKYLG